MFDPWNNEMSDSLISVKGDITHCVAFLVYFILKITYNCRSDRNTSSCDSHLLEKSWLLWLLLNNSGSCRWWSTLNSRLRVSARWTGWWCSVITIVLYSSQKQTYFYKNHLLLSVSVNSNGSNTAKLLNLFQKKLYLCTCKWTLIYSAYVKAHLMTYVVRFNYG